MRLNAEITKSNANQRQPALVPIHGLFGSLSNLGMLARAFQETHDVIQIDLRNHGLSPHSDQMSYQLMAQDVVETLDDMNVQQFHIIGHSMGGKVAMHLANLVPHRVVKLIVLDMAPVAYQKSHHDQIFKALEEVQKAQVVSRKEATELMQKYINEIGVIQFLLKSFRNGQWLFNLDALKQQYFQILSWERLNPQSNETLFLKGELSDYINLERDNDLIRFQYPQAKFVMIDGTGHWLHAEKPSEVIKNIKDFL